VAAVGCCPAVTGMGGVPAVVVILLVAASGVPDVPVVVSWVLRLGRWLIMGWCRVC
jgi:hypothetical protein